MDLWAFGPTILRVISPDIFYRLMQNRIPPKHEGSRIFLEPLTDGYDLVIMEGATK